jgi:uncharacterized protein (DUF697 family)
MKQAGTIVFVAIPTVFNTQNYIAMSQDEKTTAQKAKAIKIIRIRSALAAGTGLLPFPLLDAAGITGIQLWMLRDLAGIYGIPFRKHLAKSLTGSLLGNIGTTGLIKFIPGLGSLLGGGAVAVSGGAATYALGKVFMQHFDQGGTLLNFDPVASRAYFRAYYDQGSRELAGVQQLESSAAELQKSQQELAAAIAALRQQLPAPPPAAPVRPKRRKLYGWLLLLVLLLAFGSWLYLSGYLGDYLSLGKGTK